MPRGKSTRIDEIAAAWGHEILAQNDEGYIARDRMFPDKLAQIHGVTADSDMPGSRLLNVLGPPELRKWAKTFEEAADALDKRGSQ